MNSKSRMTPRRAQVEELLRHQAAGGGSFKKLADEAGVPLSTVNYWRKRIDATVSSHKAQESLPSETVPSGFVRVSVPKASNVSDDGHYVVRLEDISIVVPRGFDPSEVNTLIAICSQRC